MSNTKTSRCLFISELGLSWWTLSSLLLPNAVKCQHHFSNLWFNGQFTLCFLSQAAQDAGLHVSHSMLTPPLPVQIHLLCLPLRRRKIIRYFNGCQICFPNLLKGYRCYTRTSAYIWINVNFVTREIYCLPRPTTVHKFNRHVFTKCSLGVIYMAEVTDCSLIEQKKKHTCERCVKA